MRKFPIILLFVLGIKSFLFAKDNNKCNDDSRPNVIIIFTDDQGYQDLGCFDSPLIKTPHIDKMADEGIRFTDFYVSNSVCSASRASLLTGRFPARHGIGGALFPGKGHLKPKEITIAEMLKSVNYKTACFGKWHLGDIDGTLPVDQGFDEYFGIPYSNDMYIGSSQKFSKNVAFREGYNLEKAQKDQSIVQNSTWKQVLNEKGLRGKVPLFEGKEIIEYPCDQKTLTKRYFKRAIDFIDKSGDSPFFIYITPAMPHVPLYASEEFEGQSARGIYGDVIEEIDWNVGNLINYLKKEGLDKNTMIIFSSDNGPWTIYKEKGGSALPLRGGKFSVYEGGIRMPCIMRWPGKWDSGKVSNNIVSTYDLLPTVAHYAEAELPNIPIDGYNISAHLEDVEKKVDTDVYVVFHGKKVTGIRKGYWKYLPYGNPKKNDNSTNPPELYNLHDDIAETNNLYTLRPDLVKDLENEMEFYKSQLKND